LRATSFAPRVSATCPSRSCAPAIAGAYAEEAVQTFHRCVIAWGAFQLRLEIGASVVIFSIRHQTLDCGIALSVGRGRHHRRADTQQDHDNSTTRHRVLQASLGFPLLTTLWQAETNGHDPAQQLHDPPLQDEDLTAGLGRARLSDALFIAARLAE
jgi:hypothetical protein